LIFSEKEFDFTPGGTYQDEDSSDEGESLSDPENEEEKKSE